MAADKKWLFTLFFAAFISVMIFVSSIYNFSATQKPFSAVRRGPGHPPAFAYYISGTRGDSDRIFRLLLAVYHPRNRYLLHIGTEGSDDERRKLSAMVKSVPAIRAFANVDVIGKPDATTYMGASNIAAILRAAAIFLKLDGDWDWFITLSALDYPLLTQDDLSHAFSSISRDTNFIDHTSDLGWKEGQRILPIVVDPGLYLARRTQIFRATEKRPLPNAFKVFTGKVLLPLTNCAAFARQFAKNDPVLDMVDDKILKRSGSRATPGAWCTARSSWFVDPCSEWDDVNVLKPGNQLKKFEESLKNMVENSRLDLNQCT
ncbi:hypothetical protein E3N88_03896 [Mikania micrantha]|uniref:Uncharacterized protein n=1 Tax=Mikania micrantha TaxID=192012 RepID=A0A5N6PUX5_9ASTR|nr:hypothetical protein E3N88_03896 [Mikania micrantha]